MIISNTAKQSNKTPQKQSCKENKNKQKYLKLRKKQVNLPA